MGLREYQKVIAEKIDRLFKGIGREERSFVGVKLPTGGGKTFIFMDQFVKFYEEYNKENPNEDNDCISRISVKYYSPLTGINLQTQIKISKYIILEEYKRLSIPIIVEFLEPSNNDSISVKLLITTAIHYLYRIIHNEEPGLHSNICFSNNGNPIPSNLIVGIHKIWA